MNELKQHSIAEINNLIECKEKHLNYLKSDLEFKNIKNLLSKSNLKSRILDLETRIKDSICSNLPNAFWDRKQHIVDLPYEDGFNDKLIHTKARLSQMNKDVLKYCKSEINDLLQKNLIKSSKSP